MESRGLFRAKVVVPATASALARPRLSQPLAGLAGGRLAVVQGPAGYGKTTVVAEAARLSGHTVWWLSLDEFDRDPLTFLRYLAAASGVERSELPVGASAGRDVIADVFAAASPGGHVLLVLDDVHCIDGADDVCGLIDYLATRLPDNIRLILASRTPPAIPSLARLRVQDAVIDFRPDDLAFTESEVVALAQASSRPLTSEEARFILQKTDGWPVAVSLAIGESQFLADALPQFVSSEIIQRLPASLADFLTWTCVLEVLAARHCDQLLGRSDSAAVLSSLERQNVPIVKLGPQEYRLHDVVRTQLADHLRTNEPGVFRRLHQQAAGLFESEGRLEAAIPHLAEAEDWDAAATAITQSAPAAYRDGRWHAVTAWLQRLPEDQRRVRPHLVVWEARILMRFGRADEALQAITACQQGAAVIPADVIAEMEALNAAAYRIKGDFDAAIVSARRALDLAVQEDMTLTSVAEAHKQLGMALFGRGSFEDAAAELTAARDIADRRGDRAESATCNACLGSAMDALGRFAEASVALERACELWRQVGNTKELSWTLNNLAMTYFQSGEMQTARELFLEAIAKARESDYKRAETYATASLADLDRFDGDVSSAQREYLDALKLAGEVMEPSIQTHLLSGLSDVQRRQGNLSGAETSATRALVNARARGSSFEEGIAHLALARIARHKGDLNASLSEATSAQECLTMTGPSRELMETLLLRGDLLLESRRNRTELLETLARLAGIVQETGLGSLLAQIGHPHRALFEYGASRKVSGAFYHDLIRRLRTVASDEEDRGAYPTVEIRSLGGFSVTVDGRTVLDSDWESDKSKELFLLLLERAAPVFRGEIIATLWPDAGGPKAASHFHSTTYRLRRALYHGAVLQASGSYSLNPDGVFRWDVSRFRKLVGVQARREPGDVPSVENLHAAGELYGGLFAPEFDSPWIDEMRQDLEALFVDAMSRLADQLMERGDAEGALHVSTRLLANDPFSEAACGRVMRSAALSGRTELAAKTYERFARSLHEDLGEGPSPALQELARGLTSQTSHSS